MEIYYIVNTINERDTQVSGYFTSLEDAKETLKECNDWYRDHGTGRIYKIHTGLGRRPELVFEK